MGLLLRGWKHALLVSLTEVRQTLQFYQQHY